jgi:hypothetical protein
LGTDLGLINPENTVKVVLLGVVTLVDTVVEAVDPSGIVDWFDYWSRWGNNCGSTTIATALEYGSRPLEVRGRTLKFVTSTRWCSNADITCGGWILYYWSIYTWLL